MWELWLLLDIGLPCGFESNKMVGFSRFWVLGLEICIPWELGPIWFNGLRLNLVFFFLLFPLNFLLILINQFIRPKNFLFDL